MNANDEHDESARAQIETAHLAGVDLEGFSVAEPDQWGVGFLGRCEPGTNAVQARSGSWWGAWFASVYGSGHLGRMLVPGADPATMPVVQCNAGAAVTAGATPAAAVRFAVIDLNFPNPRARARHAARWPEYRKALADVHARLGSNEMGHLDDVVGDPRLMAPAYIDGTAETETLLAELYRRLDPDPRFQAFLDWAEPVVVAHKRGGDPVPAYPGAEMGPWQVASKTLLLKIHLERKDAPPDEMATLGWDLMLAPPGLDCGMKTASLFRRCMPQQTRDLVRAAAVAVADPRASLPAEVREDPLLPAVLEAARSPSYDGTAHVIAAADLRAAGRPDRAWWALAHAAFWLAGDLKSGRRWDWRLMPSLIGLAEESGWTDIAEVLRRCAPGGGRWNGPDPDEDAT